MQKPRSSSSKGDQNSKGVCPNGLFASEHILKTHSAWDAATEIAGKLILTTFRLIFAPDNKDMKHAAQRIAMQSIFRIKNYDRRDRGHHRKNPKKPPPPNSPKGYYLIMTLKCKDFRNAVFALDTREDTHFDFYNLILKRAFPSNSKEIFAFSFAPEFKTKFPWTLYDPTEEFMRQGVLNPCSNWRLSTVNSDYSLCSTYPKTMVVPKSIDDDALRKVAEFRSRGRIPVLSYKHVNQASITRSSQPMVGLTSSRSLQDESLLEAFYLANPHMKKLMVVDARPRMNAMANTAVGAGFEQSKFYPFCELKFLGIGNIHVMRDSWKKLRAAVASPDDPKWFSNLDASGWMDHIKLMIASAVRITELMDKEGASVLCHCSDGWDRTSQKKNGYLLDTNLMRGLDTAIRTINMTNEFMDCVHQLLSQFPTSFQFNANLLIFILDSLYSCQFGNFLYDNEREREEARVTLETPSLWAYILNNIPEFTNVFYRKHDRVLIPNSSRARILFWADYYLRHSHRSRSQYLTEQFHYVPSNEEYQLYFTHPPAAHSRKSRTDPRSSNNNNNNDNDNHTAEQSTVVTTTTPQQQPQPHNNPSPVLKAMSPHRTPSRAVPTRPPGAPNSHSASAPLQARTAPPDGDSSTPAAEVGSSSGGGGGSGSGSGSSSTAPPPPQSSEQAESNDNDNDNDNNNNNDDDDDDGDSLPQIGSSLPPSKGSSVSQSAPTDPPPPTPQEEKEKEEAATHDDGDGDGESRARVEQNEREVDGKSQPSS